jgi:hypothetical protein
VRQSNDAPKVGRAALFRLTMALFQEDWIVEFACIDSIVVSCLLLALFDRGERALALNRLGSFLTHARESSHANVLLIIQHALFQCIRMFRDPVALEFVHVVLEQLFSLSDQNPCAAKDC